VSWTLTLLPQERKKSKKEEKKNVTTSGKPDFFNITYRIARVKR